MLVHRYKETRRRHPLSETASGSLEQAVKMERELLRPMREAADYIIDTSYLAPSQLKQRFRPIYFWAMFRMRLPFKLCHLASKTEFPPRQT